MGTIAYNDSAFRALFPLYANTITYTPAQLQALWNSGTTYISNQTGGWRALSSAQQTQALNLMTAHLVYLSDQIAAGNTPGVITGATVDKVSVTLEPPPAPNQWQYWLQTSPYGQQLLALLQLASVGGFYANTAVPGRAGFLFGNGM